MPMRGLILSAKGFNAQLVCIRAFFAHIKASSYRVLGLARHSPSKQIAYARDV